MSSVVYYFTPDDLHRADGLRLHLAPSERNGRHLAVTSMIANKYARTDACGRSPYVGNECPAFPFNFFRGGRKGRHTTLFILLARPKGSLLCILRFLPGRQPERTDFEIEKKIKDFRGCFPKEKISKSERFPKEKIFKGKDFQRERFPKRFPKGKISKRKDFQRERFTKRFPKGKIS